MASSSPSVLEQLRAMSTVVADTGELEMIKKYQPHDATTNPSLLNKAARMDAYQSLVEDALKFAKEKGGSEREQLDLTVDKLAVNFGCEILKIIPGYVSTEVDARLSYDTEGSIERAERIIKLYEDAGVSRDRVLIKLATTWEGCQAAKVLEAKGIHCNMTLLFSFVQAAAAASAGATLISPFVGRILDWYKASTGKTYEAAEDPGVKSVTRIYNYYKAHNLQTVVMGASFRNTGEVFELAGCDRLTISPQLLEELSALTSTVERKLEPSSAQSEEPLFEPTAAVFRFELNKNTMAYEKLGEGIRRFAEDLEKLEEYLRPRLQ